jgi:MFS family permease
MSPTETRPSRVRWQIVALLVSYSFMTWFNRVSMSVAYDERIHQQTDITPTEIGFVNSAFLFAYMIFMTPGGWFIDRFGPRASLILMGFGSALFCGLTGLAGSRALMSAGLVWYALLVIRSVMGIFTAPIYPAAARMVSHWIPVSQRAWVNGLVQAAAAVGMSSAFPVFGAIIDFIDWPYAFMISGMVTALVALVWTVHARNRPDQHRKVNEAERRFIEEQHLEKTVVSDSVSWLSLLRHRGLILLTLSYAAVGYIEYLFFFWMHYYFKEVRHLEESRIYAAILLLSLAVGMIAGGWLADRMRMQFGGWLGRALVPMAAMIAGAGLLVMGVLAVETWATVAWLSLALAAVGAAEAPTWTLAVELGGRHGGTAAAICNTGGNAGGLIAPVLTPFLSGWVSRAFSLDEQAGWQWGISLGGLIGVVGAVLWCGIRPEETKTVASSYNEP